MNTPQPDAKYAPHHETINRSEGLIVKKIKKISQIFWNLRKMLYLCTRF
jgi:hypothetical protein